MRGPVGSAAPEPLYHAVLQTAELPLSSFTGVDLAQVRGVRFVFNQTTRGAIYMADIVASSHLTSDLWFGGGVGMESGLAPAAAAQAKAAPATAAPSKSLPPTRGATLTAGNSVLQLLRKGAKG